MEDKTIRCVFVVNQVVRVVADANSEGEILKCSVTTDKEGAYKDYFHWTPSGTLEIQTLRKTGFAPGDRLQVDLMRLPKE